MNVGEVKRPWITDFFLSARLAFKTVCRESLQSIDELPWSSRDDWCLSNLVFRSMCWQVVWMKRFVFPISQKKMGNVYFQTLLIRMKQTCHLRDLNPCRLDGWFFPRPFVITNALEALVFLFAAHSKLRKWLFVTNNPSSTKLRRIDRLYSSHDTAIFPTLRSQIKRIYILDSCLGGCKVGGTDV